MTYDEERIWKKLIKNSKLDSMTGCIEWQAGIASNGYGKVRYNDITTSPHRLVWKLTHGDIPTSLYVLHSCDNRKCLNIDHLFVGSHSDNMQDMRKKGRNVDRVTKRSLSDFTKEQQDLIVSPFLTFQAKADLLGISVSTIFAYKEMYLAEKAKAQPLSKIKQILAVKAGRV